MMKRLFVLLLVFALLFAGCQAGGTGTETEQPKEDETAQPVQTDAPAGPETVTALPTVLDTMEYTLYTNIFYNQSGGDYLGQTITKKGTFATIRDSFNDVTRYYVWGYLDETKCCDWQWEFVPKDGVELPPNGSLVEMTGVFAGDEAALDGYWFTDASVETLKIYDGPDVEVDMGTMSATLERVQLINMQVYPQDYAGSSVRLYGRIAGLSSVEHPYYDGAWQQEITTGQTLPAIGTLVIVTGTWSDDAVLTDCTVQQTTAY